MHVHKFTAELQGPSNQRVVDAVRSETESDSCHVVQRATTGMRLYQLVLAVGMGEPD